MLLGLISCLTGIFYNYTLENNAIFGKIGAKLREWRDFPEYAEDAGFKVKPMDRFKAWVSNPLGACSYCSTTWIAIFISIIYIVSFSVPLKWEYDIMGVLTVIGVQHILLRLWYSINNN